MPRSDETRTGKSRQQGRRLSSYIVTRISGTFVVLTVVLAMAIAILIYHSLDDSAMHTLATESQRISLEINQEIAEARQEEADSDDGQIACDVLESRVLLASPDIRVTLIGADGTVLYDNMADSSSLENHSQRPEFLEALESGESTQGRYSETLNEETIYHAVRLDDGSVLRLSMTQTSVWGVLRTAIIPALLVTVCVLVVAWLVVRRVTKRISDSFEALDLDHPKENTGAPEEIQPLLDRLEAQRLRLGMQEQERRRFTSSASHELKTPLTVISGYAEIIANGIARPEDVQDFAELIHKESGHMKAIVDDLLVLTRLDEAADDRGSLALDESVSLGKVAMDSVESLEQSALRNGIEIALDIPDDVERPQIMVRGNSRILHELARNLVENAIRYNVEGGKVEVAVDRDGSGRPFLRVSDTGIGVPPELREKIFERFFCADESRSKDVGGSGLGLAIVKHAAMLHDAQIVVRDNDPSGTVFEVVFPQL